MFNTGEVFLFLHLEGKSNSNDIWMWAVQKHIPTLTNEYKWKNVLTCIQNSNYLNAYVNNVRARTSAHVVHMFHLQHIYHLAQVSRITAPTVRQRRRVLARSQSGGSHVGQVGTDPMTGASDGDSKTWHLKTTTDSLFIYKLQLKRHYIHWTTSCRHSAPLSI